MWGEFAVSVSSVYDLSDDGISWFLNNRNIKLAASRLLVAVTFFWQLVKLSNTALIMAQRFQFMNMKFRLDRILKSVIRLLSKGT